MTRLSRTLVFIALASCAGCGKAELTDARRDHLLAGPHGWIDLTLHAPAPATADAGRPAGCAIGVMVNGEPVLNESADLAQADAARTPIGYRFVAPAGTLNVELRLSGCLAQESRLALRLPLEPDHLAAIAFDGRALSLAQSTRYEPTTLDWLRGEMSRLRNDAREDARHASAALRCLTWIAGASLAANGVLLVAFRRRRRAAG